MPRSIPETKLILKAAVKYLEEELMPTLDRYHNFKTRVTVNALNTIRREMELCENQAAAELERLRKLLGRDGNVEALSRELSERIRSGAISLEDGALRDHIRQSLADALAINNPKWMTR